MRPTPIKKEIVDRLIGNLGIQDFTKATIREVKQVAAMAEKESGVEFIKMEMGIPGLPAAQVGVDAQVKALQAGIAHSYPDIQGYGELKQQASRFVKAFIGIDIQPEGCVPVSGSMQGTFASFLTCSQADHRRDTVLFIDPGFPVQKMQLQVMGVKYETFDVYDYRGEKLGPKLESYLANGCSRSHPGDVRIRAATPSLSPRRASHKCALVTYGCPSRCASRTLFSRSFFARGVISIGFCSARPATARVWRTRTPAPAATAPA